MAWIDRNFLNPEAILSPRRAQATTQPQPQQTDTPRKTTGQAIKGGVTPRLGQTAQKIADINKKVIGKWWSSDRKSYIEFLPNGVCSEGEFYSGTWHIEQGKLDVWERGNDFRCLNGALTLIAPNIMTRDYGMGGESTRYYRYTQK